MYCHALHTVNTFLENHKMLTLDQIREALHDRYPGIVAQATGLHYNTVNKIKNGTATNVGYKTLKALSDYLAPVADDEDK